MKRSVTVKLIAVSAGLIFGFCCFTALTEAAERMPAREDFVGMSKEDIFKIYPKTQERTYRKENGNEWITFNHRTGEDSLDIITFQFENGKVVDSELNNRQEVVEEYMSEFCSRAFKKYYPRIHSAIRNVLVKLPDDMFLSVTDRKRPVLFTEYHYTDVSRFANSSNISVLEDDPPTFKDGLWMIKLSTELEEADTIAAIEGIVMHELAHRILDHGVAGHYNMKMEREANQLLKKLGFAHELSEAQRRFGK